MTNPTPPPTSAQGDHAERTVDVRGVSTHLFEAGDPAAPPLLYLHGTSLGNLWLDAHRALASHFHLFAPDIPGFGLSPRPDWMRDMDDYVLYLRDLLDTLGLERPIVAGHSLGGWMAMELAVWYPERVGSLILSNAAGIRVKGSPIADLFAMNPQELLAAIFEDVTYAAPLIPAEFSVDYILDQYRQRTTLASLAWNPHFDPKLERRLARVTCPTLILWGEKDRLIPPVYGETLHRLIAGSQLETIAGTGHMPMFEKAEQWARLISDFAAGQGGQSAPVAASAAHAEA
jgi:pimeloyl-ACP methyl ester carboxylesterase